MSDPNLGGSALIRTGYYLLRVLGRIGVFPVRVTGRYYWKELDCQRGAIAAANHESGLDAVFMNAWSPRPAVFMCRQEVSELPLLGPFLVRNRLLLPVRPGELRQNAQAMAISRRHLRAGGVLGIFPGGQGDTVIGEVIADFKPGAARLAIQAQVPLLPAGVRGSRRMMPWYIDDVTHSRRLISWFVMPFRRVELAFGPPIYPTKDGTANGQPLENTRADVSYLTQLLQSRIAELAGLRSACPA